MKKIYVLILTFTISSLSFGQITDIYISMFGEGSSNNKFMEIYNGTDADVDLSQYSISSCSNGCDIADQFDYPDNVFFEVGTIIAAGDVYVIAHGSADPLIVADQTFNFLSNGDDFMALTLAGATADSYTIIDALGDMGGDPGSGWEIAGVTNGTQNHTLVRKSTVCGPNPTPLGSFGTNAEDSEWLVGAIDTGWSDIGTYAGCASGPVLSINNPSNGQEFTSGTTAVTLSVSVANFEVDATPANGGTGDGHIHWTLDGVDQPMKYDTADETINVVDGGSHTVVMTLVNNNHQPITPEISQTVSFSVLFPCDLQVGTITSTCDSTTAEDTDTYTTTLAFTGGGTTTYIIGTGETGVITGDDPSTVSEGTIIVSEVNEGTDFVVTFNGDSSNSSCDLTRSISSPNCNPAIELPFNDNFSYSNGSLISASSWSTFSGTEGDLIVTDGQALVQHGTPSEDASVAFNSVVGSIYYAFDFTVNAAEAISGGDYEYFSLLKDNGNNFRGRLDIVNANTEGNDFTVGISTKGSTADTVWASDLSFGNTYRATVKFDQDTNIAQLWIDASSESDTSISGNDETDPGTTITQFGLRQSDSSVNESILVDNLNIAQTFNETLSTNSMSINTDFSIYPNPAKNGFVNITSTGSETIQANVYDILGKQVINAAVASGRLDVSTLNVGVYIVKLTQGTATTTKKLIVQ
ncbi:MAG: T9SS type A sorting domain-containing protein [Flavobacteriaceae bacterium]|nr:T9SS type A sorting domain-containing protein [Flavobacteriaceae bacterium]